MSDTSRVEKLREEHRDALIEATGLTDAAETEERDLTEDEANRFDELTASAKKMKADIERFETSAGLKPTLEQRDAVPVVDAQALFARAKDPDSEEKTYRPDNIHQGISFLSDLWAVKQGNRAAAERLERNRLEAMEHYGEHNLPAEYRDIGNAATTGGEFVPPLYLGSLWVEPMAGGRAFADALPKVPLPATGTAISIPSWDSGPAVAARADLGAVQETDPVTSEITHSVNEIAGMVDVGRILLMRSDPSVEFVIGRQLRRRYDAYFDTQLLAGSGTDPQHRGIRNVSGVNTVAYTDASPTAAELHPKVYDAIQKINSLRDSEADLIVMAPRRAAWLGSQLSSTFPLYQLGSLMQAAGQQLNGFAFDIGGLPVIQDKNVGLLYGASTSEDEIYVLAREDFLVMEGPLMARVHDDVGSGTGAIRLAVFAFSAFLSKRYPKGATVISGTGLIAPTF